MKTQIMIKTKEKIKLGSITVSGRWLQLKQGGQERFSLKTQFCSKDLKEIKVELMHMYGGAFPAK